MAEKTELKIGISNGKMLLNEHLKQVLITCVNNIFRAGNRTQACSPLQTAIKVLPVLQSPHNLQISV
jgi:hypothetical protein